MPRRQRLRRGIRAAAPLPAAAAAVDLGGLGERRLSRRPACVAARARDRRGAARRDPARRASAGDRARRAGDRRTRRAGRASPSSGWRSRCRRRCSCGTPRLRSPTRSAPRGSPPAGSRLRHASCGNAAGSDRRTAPPLAASLTDTRFGVNMKRGHGTMLIPVPPSECDCVRARRRRRLGRRALRARGRAARHPSARGAQTCRMFARQRPRSPSSCGARRSSGRRCPSSSRDATMSAALRIQAGRGGAGRSRGGVVRARTRASRERPPAAPSATGHLRHAAMDLRDARRAASARDAAATGAGGIRAPGPRCRAL